jgi:spore coat protein A
MQYRFRILIGSDSRFYNLSFPGHLNFVQIGTDNGLLPAPVSLQKLLLGTGERRDVIIDFSDPKLFGKTIVLENNAKTPFPRGSSVNQQTTGRIMAFKITKPLNPDYPLTTLPATLRPAITPLQTTLPARKLILFEGSDEFERLEVQLGTAEGGISDFHAPVTENIVQGSTEIWEIYNETPDAHPIHLHMVHMQLVNRQKFSATQDLQTGKLTDIRFQGPPKEPEADEAGWKDTYIMYPGEVTRVIATFDLPGLYAWHCHILSHEDHEMMRPYFVQPATIAGKKSVIQAEPDMEFKAVPNPFNSRLRLQFTLRQTATVSLIIYNAQGAVVRQLYQGRKDAGVQEFELDGTKLSSGTYFCELIMNGEKLVRKLVLEK